MRRYPTFPLLLVAFVVALVMAGCSTGPKTKAGPKPEGKPPAPAVVPAAAQRPQVDRTGWPVIVAFGDSLTAGQGVKPERNYPSLLQAELDQQGLRYRVVNAGVSGDTTAGGLARIEAVLAHTPSIVIVELGANDGLRGQPTEKMKANLAGVIERLQREKVQVVLAGMQIPPNYGPDYTQAFRQAYIDLAGQYKLTLIPFFLDGVAAKPELNQPDGIHPTAEGYELVLKNVMQVLKPLLRP